MERKELINRIKDYTPVVFSKENIENAIFRAVCKDEFEYRIKTLSSSYITYVKEISKNWRI